MPTHRPDPHANVARVVRTFLGHQHKSQNELAQALGMDAASMSRALNGKRRWTIDDLYEMAEFFGISVSIFFEDPESLLRNRWHAERTPQLATVG